VWPFQANLVLSVRGSAMHKPTSNGIIYQVAVEFSLELKLLQKHHDSGPELGLFLAKGVFLIGIRF
jgi:hypothetical protein